MANLQLFSEQLLRQVNELNSHNLELQSLLVKRDDDLANVNARLHRALTSPTFNHQQANTKTLEMERHEARQRVQDAETALKIGHANFSKAYTSKQKESETVKAQVKKLQTELATKDRELQRVRTSYASLQKQFEAEKRNNTRSQGFPTTAKDKFGHSHNEDDEEPDLIRAKQEPGVRVTQSYPTPVAKTLPFGNLATVHDHGPVNSNSDQSFLNAHLATATDFSQPAQSRSKSKKRRRTPSTECSLTPETISIASSFSSSSDSPGSSPSDTPSSEEDQPSRHHAKRHRHGLPTKIAHLKENFEFLAVTAHNPAGGIDGYDSKEDMSDILDELWEKIANVVELWAEKSDEWEAEFMARVRGSEASVCVSSKMKIHGRESGRTVWRKACEGRFACRACVREGKPCFTWTGTDFWLLPLAREDRTLPDLEGAEIRTWLNVE